MGSHKKNLSVECPVCGKRVKWEKNPFRPFCSKRCHILDLGDWASEKHRIAGQKAGPEEIVSEISKLKKTEKK